MYNNVEDQTQCAGLCTFSSWIGKYCVQQCMRRFNIVFRCIRRSRFTRRKLTGAGIREGADQRYFTVVSSYRGEQLLLTRIHMVLFCFCSWRVTDETTIGFIHFTWSEKSENVPESF